LTENQMMEAGRIVQADAEEIPFEDRKQMSSIIKYMMELKGVEPLQPFFVEDLNEVVAKDSVKHVYNQAKLVTELLGFEYISEYQKEERFEVENGQFSVSLKENQAIPIEDYSYYLGEVSFLEFEENKIVHVAGDTLHIHFDKTMNLLEFKLKGFETPTQVSL